MLRRCCDGQVVRVERLNQPILQARHGNFASAKLVFELRPHFGRFKQREALAVCCVANHDIVALLPELVGEALNLIHAVRLVVHRHDERERCTEFGHHGGQINLGEVINEQVRGRGSAIHDDETRFFESAENAVEFATVVEVKKSRIGMKPLQRRVLVVTINRDVRDAPVFEELHEVDGEEAFSDAAFAIEDEVETFHVLSGLSIRTCAMRGPRLRVCGVPLPLKSAGDSCDGRFSTGSDCTCEATRTFGSAKEVGRFRAGRLRGRTISEST